MILTVQPIGAVQDPALAEIMRSLKACFGIEVRREPPHASPVYAWDPRRQQYNSFEVLQMLARSPENGSARVLGVTECDLFIPALTFVFGQAQLDGRVAVVSLARLHQGFYGLPEETELFKARVRKEAIHEVGHTLGLVHCHEAACAMRLSTSILQVDVKEDKLCGKCHQTALGRIGRWRRENHETAVADPRS